MWGGAEDPVEGQQVITPTDGSTWSGHYVEGHKYDGVTLFTYDLIGPQREYWYTFGCMAGEPPIKVLTTK